MKTKRVFLGILLSGLVVTFFSCSKEDSTNPTIDNPTTTYLDLPKQPYDYVTSSFVFQSNDLPTLGRVLFYDTHISVNNSVSCASCHKQSLAFSDNVAHSKGFENQLTHRNALPIQNLQFGTSGPPALFWDGREKFLQTMVLKPIVNHVEMGMGDLNMVVKKVKAMPYYAELFQKAYGTTDIDINRIATALSSFTGAIVSFNTRFDNFNQNQTRLSGIEEQGRNLFFNTYNCNSCHQTQQLNGYQSGGGNPDAIGFINIGLDQNYADNGLGDLTHNAADNGKFKIPNLRNIAFTAPYMHDGRFATLDAVLEHYSHGIVNHPNLDSRLKTSANQAKEMNISSNDKVALIAFLNTLNDYSVMTDPKFSNPFKNR